MYSRETGQDTVLTLESSGWTYRDTFVLWDHETASMWYHLEGENALTCISGALADTKLEELESVLVRWPTWLQQAPHTKYLTYPEN